MIKKNHTSFAILVINKMFIFVYWFYFIKIDWYNMYEQRFTKLHIHKRKIRDEAKCHDFFINIYLRTNIHGYLKYSTRDHFLYKNIFVNKIK